MSATMFEAVRELLAREAQDDPRFRRTPVPCAFCRRGGNGDRSCASGFTARRYNCRRGCFAGSLLDRDPTEVRP